MRLTLRSALRVVTFILREFYVGLSLVDIRCLGLLFFYLRISIVVYVLLGLRMYPKLGSLRKMTLYHQDHSWLFAKKPTNTLEKVY